MEYKKPLEFCFLVHPKRLGSKSNLQGAVQKVVAFYVVKSV